MKKPESYPSDISDKGWNLIEPLIPVYPRGRKRTINIRTVINALFYLTRTGIQWDSLPHSFPSRSVIWYYFNRWKKDNTWKNINDELRRHIRVLEKRNPDPSAGILDSQSVKSSETTRNRGFDGHKKINGIKRQILVDVLGLLLNVKVHPANICDSEGAGAMFKDESLVYSNIKRIFADGAYRGPLQYWLKKQYNIVLEIVKSLTFKGHQSKKYRRIYCHKSQLELFPQEEIRALMNIDLATEIRHFKIVKWRWIVERTLSWLNKNRRLCRDYEKAASSSEAFCYLAMIRLMTNRLTKSQISLSAA
jgi:putative transposase